MSTITLVNNLKEAGQDHEFYPTTNEIIAAMISDIKHGDHHGARGYGRRMGSFLDVGAGNGKVLAAVKAAEGVHFTDLYAIEKSEILRGQLGAEVFVVGTDFEQQSLLSKVVDVVFSNPPYSQYVQWACKIIRESASSLVYLVIPTRWEDSQPISDALAFRDAKTHVCGAPYSFLDSEDREARATVNLLRIELGKETDDAFERFFNEQFSHLKAKFAEKTKPKADEEQDPGRFQGLAVGESYPETMVNMYNADMAKAQKNYELVGELDTDLLKEFGVTPLAVMKCLKQRLEGLRNVYWKEIFDRVSAITDRLTAKKRDGLLGTLSKHAHVDFTVDNIFAVILWVIKNSNVHLDDQLLETFDKMVDKANVVLYKSNLKPFVYDRWRYNTDNQHSTHYGLEYRVVLHHFGGIKKGYSFERGLAESAREFLGDLLTVARNLGFNCKTNDYRLSRGSELWTSNTLEQFFYTPVDSAKEDLLFEVRAFLNGNVHMRMNQKLALALNVEYGRLKGWLKSGAEAAEELKDKTAAALFRSNLSLPTTINPMLLLAA